MSPNPSLVRCVMALPGFTLYEHCGPKSSSYTKEGLPLKNISFSTLLPWLLCSGCTRLRPEEEMAHKKTGQYNTNTEEILASEWTVLGWPKDQTTIISSSSYPEGNSSQNNSHFTLAIVAGEIPKGDHGSTASNFIFTENSWVPITCLSWNIYNKKSKNIVSLN